MEARGSLAWRLRIVPAAARERTCKFGQPRRCGDEPYPRDRAADEWIRQQVPDRSVLSEDIPVPEGGPRRNEQDQPCLEKVGRENEAGEN